MHCSHVNTQLECDEDPAEVDKVIEAEEAKAQPATQEQEAVAAARAAEANPTIAHASDFGMAHGWQDRHQLFVDKANLYRAVGAFPLHGPWNITLPRPVAGMTGNCLRIVRFTISIFCASSSYLT